MAVRREDRDGPVVSGGHGRRVLDDKITGIRSYGLDSMMLTFVVILLHELQILRRGCAVAGTN